MEKDDDSTCDTRKQTKESICNKFALAADSYVTSVPALSRINMHALHNEMGTNEVTKDGCTCCKYCSTLFRPGNFKMKIKRRMRLNKKIKKLIQKRSVNGEQSFGKFQKKLVAMYDNSVTRIIYQCMCCERNTVISALNKPEKIVLEKDINKDTEVKSSKSIKKKLKQKLRRIAEAQDRESAKNLIMSGTSTDVLPNVPSNQTKKIDSQKQTKINTSNKSLMSLIGENPQNKTGDEKPGNRKKNKKKHGQSLQQMLEVEKQLKKSNSSSLQNFFKSMS